MRSTHLLCALSAFALSFAPNLAHAADTVSVSAMDSDFTPQQVTKLRGALATANRVLASNEFRAGLEAIPSFYRSQDDGAAVYQKLLSRAYTLEFNAVAKYAIRVRIGWKVIKRKSKMVASSGHGSGQITFNTVRMPEFGDAFYAGTIAHELSHIAGYKHRGNRKTKRNLRSVPYRVGELVRQLATGSLTFGNTPQRPGQRGLSGAIQGDPSGRRVKPTKKAKKKSRWSRFRDAVKRLVGVVRRRPRGTRAPSPLLSATPSGQLELHVIDLQIHGEALVLRTPKGKIVLVDSGQRVSSYRVVEALEALGARKIDLVILSHGHHDHMNGMRAVASKFSVERFWIPDYRQPKKARKELAAIGRRLKNSKGAPTAIEPVGRGAGISIDGVDINVLAPFRPYVKNAKSNLNANGIVAMVRYGASRWLLTGDIEHETETKLLASGADLRCQLLKVAHHGSKTSSTLPFLRATGAKTAVISSNAPYRHPHRPVLDNLGAAGFTWYQTDRNHHILVTTPGDGSLAVRTDAPSQLPPPMSTN
jgi:competence protein ComEC